MNSIWYVKTKFIKLREKEGINHSFRITRNLSITRGRFVVEMSREVHTDGHESFSHCKDAVLCLKLKLGSLNG